MSPSTRDYYTKKCPDLQFTGIEPTRTGKGPMMIDSRFTQPGSLLLTVIDEDFEKKTRHRPGRRDSPRGVSALQAAWRPPGNSHTIWKMTGNAWRADGVLLEEIHTTLREAIAEVPQISSTGFREEPCSPGHNSRNSNHSH